MGLQELKELASAAYDVGRHPMSRANREKAVSAAYSFGRSWKNGEIPPIFQKARDYAKAEFVKDVPIAYGRYPYFREISSAQDTEVQMNGKTVLMLGSNSYLGLTNDERVKAAAIEAVMKYGTGCAGSRFLNGTLDLHRKLEEALADFVGKEKALVYSTGFQTNLGVISALVGKEDYVFADKRDHASIIEGCGASLGTTLRYRDPDDLEERLKRLPPEAANAGKLIVTDGVFSMEGDIVDLPRICQIAEEYNAGVMVDDAHAIGVIGKQGRGTASYFELTDQVQLIMGTFSKSFASLGGFIASSKEVIEYLKHNSRPLIFSASMSPANAAATLKSLEIMLTEPGRIDRLWHNTHRMNDGLRSLGFDTGHTQTPVIPVYVRNLKKTLQFTSGLQDENPIGIFVNPVVSPGIPEGHELLRISLMATHTDEQIDYALDKIGKVGRELGVI